MKYFDTLTKFRVALVFLITLTVSLMGCAVKISQEDRQQLEDAKQVFMSQLEDGMHPIIWAYLDEVLHDPESFRLQRFVYTPLMYDLPDHYRHTRGTPAWHINMRYRVRVPAGGIMLKEMSFYLFKNKRLALPNGALTSLIGTSAKG